jgi:hypothetical protein
MEDSAGWGVDCREAAEAVAVSAAALLALTGADAGLSGTAGADPLRTVADDCLDSLAEVARLEARAAALKVRLSAEYARAVRSLASEAASPQESAAREMALTAEIACVLTVSERTSWAFMSEARALITSLPLTLAALQAGAISWAHARIMVEETGGLDRARAAALEAHFLDPGAPNPARGCRAGDLVPGRFRAKARTWRERHHPVSIETRYTRCVADRRVEFSPDRDGMAWFSAYLPADTAAGIWERSTAAARALQGPGEARTLTQLRADITAAWLLGHGPGSGGCGDVPVPRAQVLVTVPVLSLLGAGEEAAMLDGYGPIPPSMARALIADGAESFHRVLTNPRDGAPLEIGRTSYRLPKPMRQWLRLRDGRCPFPGCNNQSLDNDADHLLAWADGGSTGIANLGQPCRRHHRLKHGSAWKPAGASQHSPPGWTSPTGRNYPSEQQDWEPPDWPHSILNTDMDSGPPEDTGPCPGWDPDLDLPPDPGRDPDLDLPPDPFIDWYLCTAGDTDRQRLSLN